MITLRNIYKSFGNLEVLHDISLTLRPGEITAIMGPSGAGKTTLLQIAGSLSRPDRGSVDYDGTEITSLGDRKLSAIRNSRIGFVFQFHQLLPEFTAQENVALPAMIGGISKRKAMQRAAQLLTELGLADRLAHKPAAMSGGERQRTAFARALVNSPEMVFADEPTGSLDSANRDEIRNLILSLKQSHGQGFVIVTHDPEMTVIADRVIYMKDGKILQDEYKLPVLEDAAPDAGADDAGAAPLMC